MSVISRLWRKARTPKQPNELLRVVDAKANVQEDSPHKETEACRIERRLSMTYDKLTVREASEIEEIASVADALFSHEFLHDSYYWSFIASSNGIPKEIIDALEAKEHTYEPIYVVIDEEKRTLKLWPEDHCNFFKDEIELPPSVLPRLKAKEPLLVYIEDKSIDDMMPRSSFRLIVCDNDQEAQAPVAYWREVKVPTRRQEQ